MRRALWTNIEFHCPRRHGAVNNFVTRRNWKQTIAKEWDTHPRLRSVHLELTYSQCTFPRLQHLLFFHANEPIIRFEMDACFAILSPVSIQSPNKAAFVSRSRPVTRANYVSKESSLSLFLSLSTDRPPRLPCSPVPLVRQTTSSVWRAAPSDVVETDVRSPPRSCSPDQASRA